MLNKEKRNTYVFNALHVIYRPHLIISPPLSRLHARQQAAVHVVFLQIITIHEIRASSTGSCTSASFSSSSDTISLSHRPLGSTPLICGQCIELIRIVDIGVGVPIQCIVPAVIAVAYCEYIVSTSMETRTRSGFRQKDLRHRHLRRLHPDFGPRPCRLHCHQCQKTGPEVMRAGEKNRNRVD